MIRRSFLKNTLLGSAGIISIPLLADDNYSITEPSALKLSLAQWSLHRSFQSGELDPNEFATISKETYGIDAVEYVNGLYLAKATNEMFWLEMKKRADDAGVKSLLIMVDEEGDLGHANAQERKKSVENHYKWVHAAKILGCHSVRVNAFGDPDRELFRVAIVEGMGQLANYAAGEGINIIVENHGLFSSDAKLITDIVKEVDLPNFGTFPDFGNWCLSAKWGSTQGECDRVYDRYQGVREFLPYARAVSAKSYNFNDKGEDRIIDYHQMLKIVRDSGYDGYIGIEYEGVELPEHDGILATKRLMQKVWQSLD